MKKYAVLLRGINVGGKNKIPMAELKRCLEAVGFEDVVTYIQSGNIIVSSKLSAARISQEIEALLSREFILDSASIKVLVLTRDRLKAIIANKPDGFGEQPDTYHSDTIFLMGIDAKDAMRVFAPRDGVDAIWPGDGVIYSRRLSAERTKSRLSKIMGTPAYKSMTIRNWNTTTKLLELLQN